MPIPAYMTIEGETQGEISSGGCSEASIGTLSKEDQEDTIQVQAFHHSIWLPKDPQSGQPTGQRIHDELIITKIFDQTSPLLYQAMCSGENITKAEINWYRISPAGELEHYFTTTVENAVITHIRAYMPLCLDKNLAHYTHMEGITLRYRKITWSHEVCGTEGTDDWDGAEA